MLSKLLKFFCIFAIIVTVIFALHMVITLDSVDSWLTDKLTDDTDIPSALVYTEHHSDKYSLHEADKPCICFYQDKLYMVINDKPIDITPEGINISYFGKNTDFNEMISYKRNCLVSGDGKYIVYMLYFKDVSYLYYLDIELEKSFFIAEKVDSFDVVENDGIEALTVIYATGYEQHNSLFAFTSDTVVSDTGESVPSGEYTLISENISIAGVFEAYNQVVYLNHDGLLSSYDCEIAKKRNICADIDFVYFPESDKYNYDDFYSDFTVCASKGGRDYILNDESQVEIKQGYYNVIPKHTFFDSNGNLYYYSEYNKKIVLCSGGEDKVLYGELGSIYGILDYYVAEEDNSGYFVAATEKSLYLLCADGNKAEKLAELPSQYRKRPQMIEKHMAVYMVSKDVFYLNQLTSGSLILNEKNQNSWLAESESYNYGLVAIRRTEDGFESSELNIPYTRIMSRPTAVAVAGNPNGKENNLLYVSYFDDGSVKALSVLSEKGQVKKKDVLVSAAYAKGQCNIDVFPCETGTYILREKKSEGKEFLFLPPDGISFQVVVDENGVYTENYDDFSVAVSFGTLVIF